MWIWNNAEWNDKGIRFEFLFAFTFVMFKIIISVCCYLQSSQVLFMNSLHFCLSRLNCFSYSSCQIFPPSLKKLNQKTKYKQQNFVSLFISFLISNNLFSKRLFFRQYYTKDLKYLLSKIDLLLFQRTGLMRSSLKSLGTACPYSALFPSGS